MCESVKKVAVSHFFEKFRLSLSPYGSRAGKPARYKNLRFSSVLTHMSSEPDWTLRAAALNNPGVF